MQPEALFRIVLAHSSPVIRGVLAQWIESKSNIKVVGQAGEPEVMIDLCVKTQPDALVVDSMLGDRPSFEAAKRAKALRENMGLCILSDACQDREIAGAISTDAKWFVAMRDSLESAGLVFEAMKRKEPLFSPTAAARLTTAPGRAGIAETIAKGQRLSERQREVLRHVATGLSKREVAVKLLISPRTVERHVANIMSILDIHDRVHLTRFAIREGLVEA
jgi:DNA-binding NarL/FixJ family response regulator